LASRERTHDSIRRNAMCRKLAFWVSVVLVLGAASNVSADPNLVAWWKLDDAVGNTASDSSGMLHHGTVGGTATWTTGMVGGALDFDGSSNYIDVDDINIIAIGEDLTIAMWLKADAVGEWISLLSDDGWDPPAGQLHYNVNPGGNIQLSINGPPEWEVDATSELTAGVWYHVATTYAPDTGEMVVFVNGERSNEQTNANRSAAYIGPMVIGAWDTTGAGVYDRYFDGIMDDIRLYNIALTEAEIMHVSNPLIAWDPQPPKGTENFCPGAGLSWKAGDYAGSHDVYLGTDYNDVNDANSSDHPNVDYNKVDVNSYNPALGLGQIYYWRVDEVNDSNTWRGLVWQFITNDGNAFNPNPADNGTFVPLYADLSWAPGCFAASHDVYFGTDYNEVRDANSTNHINVDYNSVDVNSCDPAGDFAYLTSYYWRVDEVNDSNVWKGKVWRFRSQGEIADPNIIVWYKFDETSPNSSARDSSGYEHNGDVEGPEDGWDPNDGMEGGSRVFNNDTAVIISDSALDYVDKAITVSVWVKGAPDQDEDDDMPIFDVGDGSVTEMFKMTAIVPTDEPDLDVEWRAGNDTNDALVWEDAAPRAWLGDWHHFAFLKDEDAGTMSIYFDGVQVESRTGTLNTLAYVGGTPFKIGAYYENDNDYMGKLDDFRIYACALSEDEVIALFRGGDLGSAWGPDPYDGQIDLPYDVNLSWRQGDYVANTNGHDVYIGTDFDEVNDANSTIHPNVDYYNVSETNCDPGPLDVDQTYYWRVDEVNDSCSPYLWKGKVWKFTTAEYIIIDDFEEYTEGAGGSYPITDGWTHLYESPYTDFLLSLGLPSLGHAVRGEQSMFAWFDCSDKYYSQSGTKSLDPCDLTIAGMKMLTLWFHAGIDDITGRLPDANETEQLYVGLEDSDSDYAEVRYPMEDMNDIRLLEWTQWNIALSEFEANNPDVNLTNIETLYIGFGNRRTSTGPFGGSGYIYFDDIRLYPPSCVPSRGQPELDWNNDCIVSWGEIEIMADQWLESDVNLAPVEEPDPCVLHYEFEDGAGSNVADSSTNNYDGTAIVEGGSATDAFWEPNGVYDDCIRFEHLEKEYCVAIPNDVFDNHIDNQITICVWVNWDDPETMPGERNQLFSMHGGPAADYNGILGIETDWVEDEEIVFWDANGDIDDEIGVVYEVDEEDWSGGWNHYAFVKDVNVVPGVLKIYHNGQLVAEGDSNSPMRQPVDHAWIGMATDEPNDAHDNYEGAWHDQYTGLLDDFRIYDYALSEPEIAYLATSGTGIVTVQSIANLYNEEDLGNRAVNFRDFAILANDWLVQKLWPE
jgi:hypothetical protein